MAGELVSCATTKGFYLKGLGLLFAPESTAPDRQLDHESGSGGGAVSGMNPSPGCLDDGAGDRKAEPAMGSRPA
jgi:hypothetical protein